MPDHPSRPIDELAERLRRAGQYVALGEFTDPAGFAWLAGVSVRTVRRWRQEGIGPRPFEAHRLLYPIEACARWLLEPPAEAKNERTSADIAGHRDLCRRAARR